MDVETTGLDPVTDRIVEIGWCDLLNGKIYGPNSMMVDPGRSIPPEASAIHHLTDEDVAGAPFLSEVAQILVEDADAILVAQNNRFDEAFLRPVIGERRWIDTYRCAIRLYPDAPKHTNQVLRYLLKPDGLVKELAEPSHRAGPDAYVTAHLLREMLKLASVDQLIAWSSEPALLSKVGFGKHFGLSWADVPPDYLRWVLGQDMGEDVLFTARHHLEQRGV
jgi:exodeoxyribonuclease X